jgi:hypothetical protein
LFCILEVKRGLDSKQHKTTDVLQVIKTPSQRHNIEATVVLLDGTETGYLN